MSKLNLSSSFASRESRLVARPIESLEARMMLAAGALDPSFGNAGVVLFDLQGFRMRDAVVQPDNKIVVLLADEVGAASGLARFNPNGSIDSSFGSNGTLIVDSFSSLALQSDGRIIAAGHSDANVIVSRFLTNGTIDASFGSSGITEISDQSVFSVADVLVRPDNRIVVAGSAIAGGDSDFALFSLTPNGNPDNSFGGGAKFVATDFNQNRDAVSSIALLADGRIVASGTSLNTVTSVTELALAVYNANGTPANGFNGNGKLTVAQFSAAAAPLMMVRGGDKIVLLDPSDAGASKVVVAQFTTAGVLDTSFSGDGITEALNSGPVGGAFTGAIAIDAAGQVVIAYDKSIAGPPARDAATVVRLNADGTIDTSFNDPGALVSEGFVGNSNRLLIGPSNTLIVATAILNNGLVMARFDATHSPKAAVPTAPAAILDATTIQATVTYTADVAIDPASVAGVNLRLSGPGGFNAVASSTTNLVPGVNSLSVTYIFPAPGGTLDPGDNGSYTLASQSSGVKDVNGNIVPALPISTFTLSVASTLAELAFADTAFAAGTYFAGDLIGASLRPALITGSAPAYEVVISLSTDAVAGNSDDIPLQTFLVTTGSTTLASLGPVPANAAAGDYFLIAQIDPGDQVLEADESNNTLISPGASIRIATPPQAKPSRTIGGLDPTFGNGGIIREPLGFISTVGARVQPGGTIIIAGSSGAPDARDIGLARRLASGAADLTWGNNGRIDHDLRGTDDRVVDFRVLPDGKILVAGNSAEANGADFFVTRFDADGRVDNTFGARGTVFVDFAANAGVAPSTDVARRMLLRADGSILLVGRTDAGGDLDFALARLTPSGALDPSFGIGGKVQTDFANGDDSAQSVSFSPRGEIVVVGFTTEGPARRIAVARYTENGLLDRRFGNSGLANAIAGGVGRKAGAIAIDGKGRILVAGSSVSGSIADGSFDSDLFVARFNARGRLDRRFGDGGIARVDAPDPAIANSLRIQPGGQIVVSGVSSSTIAQGVSGNNDIVIAKLDDKGVLDARFGVNGILILPAGGNAPAAVAPGHAPLASSNAPLALLPDAETAFQESDEGQITDNQGGGGYAVGTAGPDTIIRSLVLSGVELSAAIVTAVPVEVIGGKKGSVKVDVANVGDLTADGAIDILLYTSADQELGSGDREFFAIRGATAKIKALTDGGKGKAYRAKFEYPSDILDGQYFLLAQVNAVSNIDELDPNNNEASSASAVQIFAPVVDLTGAQIAGDIAFRDAGKPTKVLLTLTNSGTVQLKDAAEVTLVFSADELLDSDDARLPVTAKVNLKPLINKTVKVTVTPSTIIPGSYFLLVILDSSNTLAEKNEANNLLASTLPSTVP